MSVLGESLTKTIALRSSKKGRVKETPLPRTKVERGFRWGLIVVVTLIFAFLVAPILVVVIESFNSVDYLSFPIEGWSVQSYSEFFSDSSWVNAILVSLRIAVVAMLIAVLIGTMSAWALMRSKSKWKNLIYGFLYSPLVVPIIVLGLAYYFFFVRLQLIGSWLAIACAYAVLGTPYVLVAVSSSLRYFDSELENAARTLGAGPIRAVRHITFPNIRSSIVAGGIFGFVVAFDEAVIILFVSGSTSVTIARKMWDSVRYDLTPILAVAGTFLIVVTVALFLTSEAIQASRARQQQR